MSTDAAGVRWDDAKARRTHANECNVSTRDEEFILSFGVSRASQAERQEVVVDLGQSIVMSPHVAKRLAVLLHRVLAEYETRFESARVPAPRTGKGGPPRGTV